LSKTALVLALPPVVAKKQGADDRPALNDRGSPVRTRPTYLYLVLVLENRYTHNPIDPSLREDLDTTAATPHHLGFHTETVTELQIMPSKRVLLTGANTLIGSHILEQLLSFNVSVRAVVGSREEAEVLQRQYPHRGPNLLEIAVVGNRDLLAPGAYDDVLDGDSDPFDTVIHTITADPYDEADCLSRFINLKTEALINFAKSIKDVAKNVQRVVITTSLTPFARWLVDPQMEERSARRSSVVSTSYQNAPEIDSDYVLATSQASDNIVYDALWKWTKDVRAPFSLVAVTAPSVYGPSIRPLENSSNLEEANRRIWNICGNDANERLTSPPYGVDFFTDVRVSRHSSVCLRRSYT
jgi:nucleoside-diphosphate-sugar epimerase